MARAMAAKAADQANHMETGANSYAQATVILEGASAVSERMPLNSTTHAAGSHNATSHHGMDR